MDNATEVLQMRSWVLALAVGRVAEQCCRRRLAAEWTLVTNIDPQ